MMVINFVASDNLIMEKFWVALGLGVALSVSVEETCWLKISVGETVELINTGEAVGSLWHEVAVAV